MDGAVYAGVGRASAACRVRAERGQAPDLAGDGGTFAGVRGIRQEEKRDLSGALCVKPAFGSAGASLGADARRGAHRAHFYGSGGVFAGGLLSAVYVYQFLHLHRQYGNIEAVRSVLQSLVAGRELAVGIGASQIISNVPAALLLADFTQDIKNLTIGVNLGGLGTLIASMASLISYKIYAHNYNKTKGHYLLWFTIANVLFLAVLVLVYVFIS